MSDEPLKATPADQAPPVNFKAAQIAKLQAANKKMWEDVRAGLRPPPNVGRRRKTADANAPATPPPAAPSTETPTPPAPPAAPPKPKKKDVKEIVESLKWQLVTINVSSMEHPSQRVPTMIREVGELIEHHDQDTFWTGTFSGVGHSWQSWSRITQHGEALRKFLLAHQDKWPVASLPGAQRTLAGLPDVLVVFRGCAARNKCGLTWCSTEAAARAYPLSPAFREKEPLLITAAIPKERVVSLRETHHGFEVLALVEPSDITSETKL